MTANFKNWLLSILFTTTIIEVTVRFGMEGPLDQKRAAYWLVAFLAPMLSTVIMFAVVVAEAVLRVLESEGHKVPARIQRIRSAFFRL